MFVFTQFQILNANVRLPLDCPHVELNWVSNNLTTYLRIKNNTEELYHKMKTKELIVQIRNEK